MWDVLGLHVAFKGSRWIFVRLGLLKCVLVKWCDYVILILFDWKLICDEQYKVFVNFMVWVDQSNVELYW